MTYVVKAELSNPADEQLLIDCAEAYSPTSSGKDAVLFVSALGRFGYTNSRLYRVTFRDKRRRSYVVKTDDPDIMRDEGIATTAVRDLPGAERAHLFPAIGDCRAIIFPLIARGEDVMDLSELLFPEPAKKRPEDLTSADLLKNLYRDLRSAHSGKRKKVTLGEEYEAYLHEDSKSTLYDAISEYFTDLSSVATIDGVEVKNPARILERVKALRLKTLLTIVHGDLHPKNVMLDRGQTPQLIDFAWGCNGAHWLKDFVLMETSIRFVEPPHSLLNQEYLRRADLALDNGEGGCGGVRDLAETAPVGTATADVLAEMADTIEAVRRAARTCWAEYDYREYLLASYLILMGGLRLKAYQHTRVLLTVGRLADKLEPVLEKMR